MPRVERTSGRLHDVIGYCLAWRKERVSQHPFTVEVYRECMVRGKGQKKMTSRILEHCASIRNRCQRVRTFGGERSGKTKLRNLDVCLCVSRNNYIWIASFCSTVMSLYLMSQHESSDI